MVDKQHGEIVALDGPLGVDGIHVTHNYSFANESTQDTFTVTVTDIGKVCRRLDIDGFFIAVTAGTGLENWKRFDNAANQVFSINQAGHGLSVLDSVRSASGNFIKAQADDPVNCGIGVVSEVASVDDFVVVTGGAFRAPAHGFTLDAILYTSPTVAGELTEARPVLVGEFQNPMCSVFNDDILIVLGWAIEQSPTIQNRLILLSSTPASPTSTGHPLQLGADGSFRFVMSGGVFQVLTAAGADGNFRMQSNQYRMILGSVATVESSLGDPFVLRKTTSVTLAGNFAQRMGYTSDTGAVIHGTVGFANADGFRFANNKTGTTNKNWSFIGTPGALVLGPAFECTAGDVALVVPTVANEATVTNTKNGAIFYDTSANAFKFRENGVWVTGSGLA